MRYRIVPVDLLTWRVPCGSLCSASASFQFMSVFSSPLCSLSSSAELKHTAIPFIRHGCLVFGQEFVMASIAAAFAIGASGVTAFTVSLEQNSSLRVVNGGANVSAVSSLKSSGNGRRSTWAQQLSWKKNAAKSLVLASSSSVRLAIDRSARCATTEEIDAEKELIEEDAMERMDKTLETVRSNFNSVRTGRASPNLLDRVEVEYYGTNVILKSIAQVTTPDGSTILVQPFDKSSLPAIEKAIIKSDVGLNPNNDGNVIRLNVPQLTSERRKELLKLVSKLSEEGKVALRNVRRDSIKAYEKLEKEKKLSSDNVKDFSDDIQKLTDDYVKKIDAMFKEKEKELTTV